MTGLQSIDGVISPQQPVPVRLLDIAPLKFLDCVPLVVLGKFLDEGTREDRQVTGRRIMLVIWPSGCIHEMRRCHSKRLRVLIHHFGEYFFRTGHVFGQSDACIVARLHDDAQQQVLYANPAADFDEHTGALHAPGFLAYRDFIFKGNLALADCMEDDVGRHQLGQAGGWHRRIGFQRREFVARPRVDHQIARRANDGRGRNGPRLRENRGADQ